MQIREHVDLQAYTTFRIGGPARFFICVKNSDELSQAVAFAQEKNVPLFVLGGGSNILVGDKGFPGLVIKMEIESLEYMPHTDSSVLAVVGAGVNWDAFVGDTVMRGLGGLENLSLIPGTVGAAPVQNIGAYGSEVKESIEWVETLDSKHGTIRIFQKDECAFEYRDSFFKKGKGKNFIITRVAFKLNTKPVLNVQYKELAQRFAAHTQPPTLAEVRNAVIEIRKQKLPDVRDVGTAGSFFKNPIITREMYATLHTLYPEMPCFEIDAHFVKIPAAWILDNVCGFKGHQEGSVGVYKNQALVLVNNGNAHAHDIAALAQKMQSCVFEKTHISLEREVQYIAVE